jgi:acetamidase/formamidase
VRGAEAGEVLEVHFQRLLPLEWGSRTTPGSARVGAVPDIFPEGHIKYFNLNLEYMSVRFRI